jgi:hypothetical protein
MQKTAVKQGTRSRKAPCELVRSGNNFLPGLLALPTCLLLHGENSSRGAGSKTSKEILAARAWAGPIPKIIAEAGARAEEINGKKSKLDVRWKPDALASLELTSPVLLCAGHRTKRKTSLCLVTRESTKKKSGTLN